MNRELIDLYRMMLNLDGKATVKRITRMYYPEYNPEYNYEIEVDYEVGSGRRKVHYFLLGPRRDK